MKQRFELLKKRKDTGDLTMQGNSSNNGLPFWVLLVVVYTVIINRYIFVDFDERILKKEEEEEERKRQRQENKVNISKVLL